jgi:hypothetical protein
MQDLVTFGVVRAPRRPDLNDHQKLPVSGELVGTLARLFKAGSNLQSANVQQALTTWRTSNYNPLDYTSGASNSDGLPDQDVAVLLGELEAWLATQQDRPASADLLKELKQIQSAYTNATPWAAGLDKFSQLLCSWLVYWAATTDTASLATGTRFLLVAAVAAMDDNAVTGLSPGDAWDLLNRRVVLLPSSITACLPRARVRLVRDASVADLQVVRSEWRGYVLGEVAAVRNVMAGETLEETSKQTSETETTQTTETQTTTTTQTTSQQTEQSDLSRQINTQLQANVQGYVNAQYERGTPGNKLTVNAGVSGGVQIGRSESLATKVSRQAVSAAVSTVESKTRELRSQRELVRTELTLDHKFQGDTGNKRGVYRWLDRIDRFQVFTYPNRLQLEFQLPSPAEYLRSRIAGLVQTAGLDQPPPWAVKASDITDDASAMALAVKYRASNLPSLPDAEQSITKSITAKSEDLPTDPAAGLWTAPTIMQDVEIVIPDGYAATDVGFSGYATPFRGHWLVEKTGPGDSGNNDEIAYHTIVATIAAGNQCQVFSQESALGNQSAIQGPVSEPNVAQPLYGAATLATGTNAITLSPGATGSVKVGVQVAGATTMSATISVKCKRTTQAESTWRNEVYDALYSAWSAWNQAWQSAQQTKALDGSLPTGESSPDRNDITIRDELKRQVIEWLLNESPFQGRNGLMAPPKPGEWREIDLTATLASAATIQFLEQAFEWSNLDYIFYPYYWANRDDWNPLLKSQATDIAYERFLKAGSARVVVPARPGMEAAVHHWLIYQQPYLGRPMPIIGDPMYVSVATEIRDLMVPPEDGLPGDSWEAQIGTTFLWLEDSGSPLPENPLARLGAPPHGPSDPLYPPKTQS